MEALAQSILKHSLASPSSHPLTAKELQHLGNRAAIDQALSRLVREGTLVRVGRGIYMRPIRGRFGARLPSAVDVVEAMAAQRGETIVRHGAAVANAFGLTTQVPVREVYLTSGRNRRLKFGAQVVELRHAPAWQLIPPGCPAGDAVRMLTWLGPKRVGEGLRAIKRKLPQTELAALVAARGRLPTWLAQEVSAFAHV